MEHPWPDRTTESVAHSVRPQQLVKNPPPIARQFQITHAFGPGERRAVARGFCGHRALSVFLREQEPLVEKVWRDALLTKHIGVHFPCGPIVVARGHAPGA
jgi:hypothetical protein